MDQTDNFEGAIFHLRHELTKKFGISNFTKTDFEALAAQIDEVIKRDHFLLYTTIIRGPKGAEKIKENDHIISYKSLSRFFNGTINENRGKENRLNILTRSLGYSGFDEFCVKYKEKCNPNNLFDPFSIVVERLEKGEKVMLGWYPEYYGLVEYLGNYRFRIIEENGLLSSKGKEFEAIAFDVVSTYYMTKAYDNKLEKEINVDGYKIRPSILIKKFHEDNFEE